MRGSPPPNTLLFTQPLSPTLYAKVWLFVTVQLFKTNFMKIFKFMKIFMKGAQDFLAFKKK